MASTLSTMKVSYGKGLGALFAGTAVGFGASVALGTLYGKYRDKWYGQWMPAIFAAGGKLAAVSLYLASKGRWAVATTVANDLGQAGVNALGLDLGVKAGLKWAGEQLVVMPHSAALPAGAHRIAGELPPAQMGRSLDEISVEELANLR
jgi:hypothetical protein